MQLFDTIVYFTVLLQVINFYLFSMGYMRTCYWLSIVVYSGYAVVEGWLGWRDPQQSTVWLFVGLDLWAIFMAVRGLRRLRHGQG